MGIAILTSVKGHQLAGVLGCGPFGARIGTVLGESDGGLSPLHICHGLLGRDVLPCTHWEQAGGKG